MASSRRPRRETAERRQAPRHRAGAPLLQPARAPDDGATRRRRLALDRCNGRGGLRAPSPRAVLAHPPRPQIARRRRRATSTRRTSCSTRSPGGARTSSASSAAILFFPTSRDGLSASATCSGRRPTRGRHRRVRRARAGSSRWRTSSRRSVGEIRDELERRAPTRRAAPRREGRLGSGRAGDGRRSPGRRLPVSDDGSESRVGRIVLQQLGHLHTSADVVRLAENLVAEVAATIAAGSSACACASCPSRPPAPPDPDDLNAGPW